MGDFKNEFSWSFSRHRSFNLCKRLYFFTYYGFWGGWEKDAEESTRTLYRLKKMTTLPMLIGSLVHEIINRVLDGLKKGKEMPVENAQRDLIGLFKRKWRESKQGEWMDDPKWKANLFEHYYDEELTEDHLLQARETMMDSIRGFYDSDSYHFIKTLSPREWLTKEEIDSFDFEGTNVWVKLDFAARHGEKIYIYDWKTGREVTEDETQLAVYGLYAMNRWAIELNNLRLFDIYLKKQLPVKMKLSRKIVRGAREAIAHSIREMKALLDDELENRANIENFPMTDEKSLCRRCAFKGICYPDSWRDI
ncbi:MAG: PD-(D/E)XK nuclease family protein [Fidelibacterota bacterium]